MVRTLVRSLIELLLFLEFSGEETVNPDAAVAQLEAVAALLRDLPEKDRAVIIDEIISIGKVNPDPRAREFIVGLPGSLGLL
jgi:hypothetical protein